MTKALLMIMIPWSLFCDTTSEIPPDPRTHGHEWYKNPYYLCLACSIVCLGVVLREYKKIWNPSKGPKSPQKFEDSSYSNDASLRRFEYCYHGLKRRHIRD